MGCYKSALNNVSLLLKIRYRRCMMRDKSCFISIYPISDGRTGRSTSETIDPCPFFGEYSRKFFTANHVHDRIVDQVVEE